MEVTQKDTEIKIKRINKSGAGETRHLRNNFAGPLLLALLFLIGKSDTGGRLTDSSTASSSNSSLFSFLDQWLLFTTFLGRRTRNLKAAKLSLLMKGFKNEFSH